MNPEPRRELLLHKGWLQASLLVLLFGFFVLGLLAYRAYTQSPPLPRTVVSPSGQTIFTHADIMDGQELFLGRGLMEYGSIYGHGGYLGPDFTADYLRHAANHELASLGDTPNAAALTARDFKANRYDPKTQVLTFSQPQADAFAPAVDKYRRFFSEPSARTGLRPDLFTREETRKLTAFFAWTAWTSAALRPGAPYSYTNNWPPEPRVDNVPTGPMVVWSVLSLVALLGGIGLMLAAFGRWRLLGWHGREEQPLRFVAPDKVALTPSQRTTAGFFLVMSLLFLVQVLLGGATQHYRAELSNFFGFDLARWFPFNMVRTWHLQLSILWVSTGYLAAGLFIAAMVSRSEPPGQNWLACALLGALVVVVVGSLVGEGLGIAGLATGSWFVIQGFEYLDLGRFWQVLLIIGLFFWVALIFRALRTRLKTDHAGNMPWLFFYSALAIPAFYAVGLLAMPRATFAVTDYWRFWVVHLWVEDFLELFTTVMVAYLFVLIGVVDERVALRLIYLEILLYSAGGMIGTMHHVYFSGTPVEHMALGAFFSAAEVIPLTLLTVEAWSFIRLGHLQDREVRPAFPHRWAVMFLVAAGFWNFLGAGVFGFLINLPIVSFYEIGTALTANHGHASMMGVYGMLSVGLALFALRYLIPEKRWSDKPARLSFWALNLGLAWMVFANLFPLGIIQLGDSVSKGYFEARELKYLAGPMVHFLEWLRFPGDMVLILGVPPLVLICWRGVRYRRSAIEGSEPMLFTEPVPTAEVERR